MGEALIEFIASFWVARLADGWEKQLVGLEPSFFCPGWRWPIIEADTGFDQQCAHRNLIETNIPVGCLDAGLRREQGQIGAGAKRRCGRFGWFAPGLARRHPISGAEIIGVKRRDRMRVYNDFSLRGYCEAVLSACG